MNWSFVIPLLVLLAVKLVGTTLFLQYFSQILSTTTPLEKEVLPPKNRAKECPIGWELFDGACYFFSIHEHTWENSRKDCQRSGTDLVVIKSNAKLRFLKGRTGNANFFIGLKRDSKGTWKWIDGTDLDQNIINIRDNNNNCGTVGVSSTGSVFCSVPTQWICEMIPVNR